MVGVCSAHLIVNQRTKEGLQDVQRLKHLLLDFYGNSLLTTGANTCRRAGKEGCKERGDCVLGGHVGS